MTLCSTMLPGWKAFVARCQYISYLQSNMQLVDCIAKGSKEYPKMTVPELEHSTLVKVLDTRVKGTVVFPKTDKVCVNVRSKSNRRRKPMVLSRRRTSACDLDCTVMLQSKPIQRAIPAHLEGKGSVYPSFLPIRRGHERKRTFSQLRPAL